MNDKKTSSLEGEKLIREKHESLERLLNNQYVMIQINTTAAGVVLPSQLLTQPSVTLQISRLFRGKMKVTKREIVADLLFDEEYFTCTVPLTALWGISTPSGEARVWPTSLPEQSSLDDRPINSRSVESQESGDDTDATTLRETTKESRPSTPRPALAAELAEQFESEAVEPTRATKRRTISPSKPAQDKKRSKVGASHLRRVK